MDLMQTTRCSSPSLPKRKKSKVSKNFKTILKAPDLSEQYPNELYQAQQDRLTSIACRHLRAGLTY